VRIIYFILLAVLFVSCDQRNISYSKEVVLENGWSYGNKMDFDFMIPDTTAAYDLILEIDHDKEYGFQNFYTHFTTSYPDGKEIKDVVSIELADQFGQWMGDCGRNSCVAEILLSSNTLFRSDKKHKISIEQYTRDQTLQGVKSVNFLLVRK
jgi:gliding motility-associated lipoprotein GldH